MKKAISFLAFAVAGIACLVAAYFCHFYYHLYRDAVTGLESRVNGFDMRLATLEGHKTRELTPIRVWGIMSTLDHSPDKLMRAFFPPRTNAPDFYETVICKGGPAIRPEIRLPVGSTNLTEFNIHVGSDLGTVTAAWLSPRESFQDLTAFEWINVDCPKGTNVVRMLVQLKPKATVKVRFEMVILCLR